MKAVKFILGILLALASFKTLLEALSQERGAGLAGSVTGFVIFAGISIWLISSGLKKESHNTTSSKLSPVDRFTNEVLSKFDREANHALTTSPNEIVAGISVSLAISQVYKSFMDDSSFLSLKYAIPENTVKEIIKKCNNTIVKSYLDNAEEYILP